MEISMPDLEVPPFLLRMFHAGDVDDLFHVFSNPKVMRYWSFPAFEDRGQSEQFVAETMELCLSNTMWQWAMFHREHNKVVGTVTLNHLDFDNLRAEIGYALHPDYWGHGWMNLCLRRVLSFAFEELAFNRIEADVDPRNEGSIKSLERLGFIQEGYLRERWTVNSEVQDSVIFGLLAREFNVDR